MRRRADSGAAPRAKRSPPTQTANLQQQILFRERLHPLATPRAREPQAHAVSNTAPSSASRTRPVEPGERIGHDRATGKHRNSRLSTECVGLVEHGHSGGVDQLLRRTQD